MVTFHKQSHFAALSFLLTWPGFLLKLAPISKPLIYLRIFVLTESE